MGSLIQVSITGVANDDLRIVSVSTGSPDFRYLDQYNKVILTTNNQVADCTLNAEGQLSQLGNNVVGPYLCIHEDLYGLYHIDETVDDCDTPDTPLNAMVESTYRSGKSAHANYSCVDGYRLKLSKSLQSPTCLENGDWTSYNYQPCEAIYCDKDKTDYVIVRFDQSAASGSRFPTGTKGFLSCSTSRDKRYVVCDRNGSWLPETALCETPFVNLKGLAIGLTVTLVVVVFGIPLIFYWLYRRTQEAPSAVEVPMEHFYTEPLRPNQHYESVNYDYIRYDYSVTS
ncbi:hypothetical protein HDE_14084 [Halotydeus destructor]|nr:hypothetical protein HDE_14084 [Halotydeus destructor]